MQVQSLGQEDPLEEEMAVFPCSILARRVPWTEEPDGLQSMGLQRAGNNSSNLARDTLYKSTAILNDFLSI